MSEAAGFCHYQAEDNSPAWGVLAGGKVHSLGAHGGERVYAALNDDEAMATLLLSAAARSCRDAGDTMFLPPILPGARILCIGLNYGRHILETGRNIPDHPVVFSRTWESFVGHGQPIECPAESEQLDYEGEVALVIGRPGRRIPETEALAHIAGFCLANDGSVRDWQFHTHQYLPGKNFDASGSLGPAIVPRTALPNIANRRLTTRIGEEEMQSATPSDMLFPFEKLVSYCSTFMRLHTGDIILTGTPDGVGSKREPPRFLRAGDRVTISFDGVPELSNPVVASPGDQRASPL